MFSDDHMYSAEDVSPVCTAEDYGNFAYGYGIMAAEPFMISALTGIKKHECEIHMCIV